MWWLPDLLTEDIQWTLQQELTKFIHQYTDCNDNEIELITQCIYLLFVYVFDVLDFIAVLLSSCGWTTVAGKII
jgi:hypothetical protein